MQNKRLKCFWAVAEELHFRRAAERLNIAQPAVSTHVAQLERELGAALFVRSRRKVELTAAGEALLGRVRDLLPAFDEALGEARAISLGINGRVRIGFVGSAAYRLLPAVVRTAERVRPGLQIILHQMMSTEQEAALRAGSLDLALVRRPSDNPEIRALRVVREPFVVALPRRSKLARRSCISPASLDGVGLITLPKDAGPLREAMIGVLTDARAVPRIVDEIPHMPAILGLVASGRAIALVPASVSQLRLQGLVYRPLTESTRAAELWLLRKKSEPRKIVLSVERLISDLAYPTGS